MHATADRAVVANNGRVPRGREQRTVPWDLRAPLPSDAQKACTQPPQVPATHEGPHGELRQSTHATERHRRPWGFAAVRQRRRRECGPAVGGDRGQYGQAEVLYFSRLQNGARHVGHAC